MQCFVISPIGEEGSDTRKASDDVFEFIIQEALVPLGFTVERADMIAESGLITTQIIERIVSSDLVVADLTHHNANVFYELAIRHITGKPFIHMISEDDKIPFDVAASRTIIYSTDLAGAKRAKHELAKQAQAFRDHSCKVESPVSVALDLKALSSSEDPVQTALGRIEVEMTKIRSEVATAMKLQSQAFGRGILDFAVGTALGSEKTGWTEERLELLKSMWGDGASATQIAEALGGITRNAVIGKIHRLGLNNRKTDSDGE